MTISPTTRLRELAGPHVLAPLALVAAVAGVAFLVVRFPLPLAIVLCGGAVAIGAALAWPVAGLAIYVALIFGRPEDFFPELVGLRRSLLVACAAAFSWALRLASVRRGRCPEGRPWSPPLVWMLAFVAAGLFSLLPLPPATISEGATDLVKLLIIVLLVTQLVNGSERLGLFWGLLLAASCWLAVVSLVNYYTGHGFLSPQGFRARGNGAFEDPNDTALALVPAVPLALAGLFGRRAAPARWTCAAILGLLFWALYLTNSRGGFLALALALLVFASLRYGARGAVAGALLCTVVLLFGPSRIEAAMGGDDSAAGRIGAWAAGLRLFLARPLSGVGMDQFDQYHELTAHNTFVLVLAEMGVLGAVAWTALVGSVLRRADLARRVRDPSASCLYIEGNDAAQAALVGYLAAAMFLSKTYFEVGYLYLGLAAVTAGHLLRGSELPASGRGVGWPPPG